MAKLATTKQRAVCSYHHARWVWRLIEIGVLARKSREWDNYLTVVLATRISRARIGRDYLISQRGILFNGDDNSFDDD